MPCSHLASARTSRRCGPGAGTRPRATASRSWSCCSPTAEAGTTKAPPTSATRCRPAARWRQAEARLLAQRVADLVAGGQAGAGDVAVLVRATGDIPVYERALEDRGLATLAAGAGGYWSHQQVNDLLAYLAAVANPMDERALYATLASPLVGVSSDGLALLARAAREAGLGPWAALEQAFGDGSRRSRDPSAAAAAADGLADSLPEPDRERMANFGAWLAAERRGAARHTISELLERAIVFGGYEQFVLGLRWGARRLANVHKLLRLARNFEASEGRDLRAFLDHASRQAGAQAREGEAPIEDAELDAVRLMTIHAAKGLEFGVVAVADLGRQGRTDVPDLLVDGDRVGLRLLTLDGAGPTPALAFEDLRRERLEAEAREEERVLYVAMTRARERLLLSGAVNLERWPASRPGMPAIGWLAPALAEGLRERLDAEQPLADLSPPGAPGARVRCWLNAPETVGRVLREPSLRGPALTEPVAPPPAGSVAAMPARRTHSAARAPEPSDASPAAPLPDSISYTSLAEFERCGYRYYLERVLGLPPADPPAPRDVPAPRDAPAAREAPAAQGRPGERTMEGRLRGTLVHRLLESLDYSRPRPPESSEVERVARELGASPDARERRQIAELVAAVAGTELGARLAGAARVHREHAFAFALGPGEPLLTGVVDAIAHELDGTSLIVDYKSDRVGEEDLAALTERAYGIQRRIYALAALRSGALEVEVVHWFLERPTEPVRVRHVAADADGLADALRARMADLRAGSFRVTDHPHRELCLTCPGRRGLCSWSESETLRPAKGE